MRDKATRWIAGCIAALASLDVMAGVSIRSEGLPPYPDALGVAAPVAGVYGKALLVGGGANFPDGFPWENGKKVWHDRVYALKEDEANWIEVGRLPGPLGYAVTFSTDRGVAIVGGSDAERHHSACRLMKWDGTTLRFESLPDLPIPVANACGAMVGSRMMVAGGESAPGATFALTNIWMLDLKAEQPAWESLPSWPGPARTLPAAGVQGGRFYLVGGVDLAAGPDGKPVRTYLRDAYQFDPAKRTWRKLADLPNPVAAAPSPMPAVGPSHLLLLGGDDGSRYGFQPVQEHPGFPPRVLAYDIQTDRWASGVSLPFCRVTVPAVEWRGQTIIPSGEVRPGVRSPEVNAYQMEVR